jgi:hypothetical protein
MPVKSIVGEDAPASPTDIVPTRRIVIGVDLISSQEISITFVGPK